MLWHGILLALVIVDKLLMKTGASSRMRAPSTLPTLLCIACPLVVPWLVQIVLSGEGKNFCTGIDINSLMAEFGRPADAAAAKGAGDKGGAGGAAVQPVQPEPEAAAAGCHGRQRYHFRCG